MTGSAHDGHIYADSRRVFSAGHILCMGYCRRRVFEAVSKPVLAIQLEQFIRVANHQI